MSALKLEPAHRASHIALADYFDKQPGELAAEQARLHRAAAEGGK